MHHYVEYSGHDTADDRKRALEDIIDYVGKARFKKITKAAQEYRLTQRGFMMAISFAGVAGYPAKVWYDHCYGPGSWVDDKEGDI